MVEVDENYRQHGERRSRESELMQCEHRDGNVCQVATRFASHRVRVTDEACLACCSCSHPRRGNYVTLSIALSSLHSDRIIGGEYERLLVSRRHLLSVGRGSSCLPGSQLAIIVASIEDCVSFKELEATMNLHGAQWCREHLDEIVDQLIESIEASLAAEDVIEVEPEDHDEKIPWWIRQGHKIPGATRMIGKRLVLRAIDIAEKEYEDRRR